MKIKNKVPLVKKITNAMLEILMDCHERELMNQAPLNYPTRHAKGLIVRGYLSAGLYLDPQTNKGKLVFCITPEGKECLNKM